MSIDDLEIGDRVFVNCLDGFDGHATVVGIRPSPNSRFQVQMEDNNPSRPFWAHDFELEPIATTKTGYDSRPETRKHVGIVRTLIHAVTSELDRRAQVHDASKFLSPEVEVFDEFTPKLAGLTYGSDEYRACLAQMKPALDHHNAANDHHPEHYPEPVDPNFDRLKASRDEIEFGPYFGTCMTDAVMCMDVVLKSKKSRIRGMSLPAIMEMLCDWKAASLRHNDGDIRRSIEINQHRFGYSDEFKQILLNTVPFLDA